MAGAQYKGGHPRVYPKLLRSDRAAKAGPQLLVDGRRKLEAGADPKLLVGAAEVAFDRLLGHKQRLCDRAVGSSLDRLTAHPPLRGGQCVRPGQLGPCTPPGSGVQLCLRAFGEQNRAAVAGELDRNSLRLAALAAPVRRFSSAPRSASA